VLPTKQGITNGERSVKTCLFCLSLMRGSTRLSLRERWIGSMRPTFPAVAIRQYNAYSLMQGIAYPGYFASDATNAESRLNL
jgi:hypothetical protein